MRKIILLCSAGMSTSMLMQRMREAAEAQGYACTVDAYPVSEAKKVAGDADIVLLAPQIRFNVDAVAEQVACPVAAMDMMAYGLMDGAKAIAQVKEVLGD